MRCKLSAVRHLNQNRNRKVLKHNEIIINNISLDKKGFATEQEKVTKFGEVMKIIQK